LLHRFSLFVTFMTLLLVVAGALVTSNDAGGAIPDWPLAWGRLVPPLEGGIVYAYGHRVLAATVAALAFVLGWKSRNWLPFVLVVAQATLGALATKMVMPKATVLAHACLAQLTFGAMVYAAARLYFPRLPGNPLPVPQIVAAVALFAQTILGAAVRHQLAGLAPHLAGAGIASVLVLWAVVPRMIDHMREAGALLALVAFQIFLGMGAYLSRSLPSAQPLPMMVGFTAAHVAVGSMAFGAAIVLALSVHSRRHSETVSGGMVAA
jgi:cytochrome c oxidase assembly protein subunit 15